MRLADYRYEEIKATVVQFFEEQDITCVPISGFEIATKLDIKVIPYSAYSANRELLERYSEEGFSINRAGQWYIYYNDTQPYARINFTIMHEIAHIVLDHKQESQVAKMEADFFAKFALAPPVLMHKFNVNDSLEVSEIFGLSQEAAIYAFEYYQKWLKYSGEFYADYELKLLNMFSYAV